MDELTKAFTANGRIKPAVSVTPKKVSAVKALVESALSGDREAKGKLEQVLTTSDALFSYAHLTGLNFLPQYDRLQPTWNQIATNRSVPDFRKPVLYSIVTDWAGLGREGANPEGVSPIIPEGAPYPYAYMSGEESIAGGIVKRGFKTDFMFEAFINDSLGFIQSLPGEMARVARDTEDYETYAALINGLVGVPASQLAGGTTVTGATVANNAPISRDALLLAIQQLSTRKVNGRFVQLSGSYNLLVPIGQKIYVEYWLSQTYQQILPGGTSAQTGGIVYGLNGYDPLAGISIIESQWITGTNWYLMPTPGSTARPVLDHATLIGHETPEIRVENFTGTYVGGGAVSPFEGSFDNDSATFRLRTFGGGILWSTALVLWSKGDSSAPA